MKDGIIIQARTGSTRLHNKILLPFYGEQRIIDILIENIRRACPDKQVILATTVRPQDDVLEQVARGAGIDCFRGDEDNVLDRFIRAAEAFGLDRFIRVCSDNPFLRPDTFQTFFDAFDEEPADYIAYGFADGRPTISLTWGCLLSSPRKKRCVALPCLRRKTLYRTRHDLSLYSSRRLSRQIVASARRIGRTIRLAFHAGYNGRFPVASASLCRVVRADRP